MNQLKQVACTCTHLPTFTHAHSQQAFRDHDIVSGNILAQLCENHLKEMGVGRVGHRLELLGQIDQLRSKAGLVQRSKFVDIPTLLKQ